MERTSGDGGGQDEVPAPSPSQRVDLEASLLAAQLRELDGRPNDEPTTPRARILMVVSPDAETRYYVRDCLRARDHIRVVEVASPANVALIAQHLRPDVIVTDNPDAVELPSSPVIVLGEDQPRPVGPLPEKRQTVVLARPFNAESLLALVDQLL